MRSVLLALILAGASLADTTVPVPEPTPAQLLAELERTGHVVLTRISFTTGKPELRPESEPLLEEIRRFLERHPNIHRLRIESHTDSRGAAQWNLKLSQDRADAIRTWLVGHGVPPQKLEAVGLGETRPISHEPTAQGFARNRRIELHVVDPGD